MSRKVWFPILSFCLPLVLLLVAEGILRWMGAAENQRTPFIPLDETQQHLILNPAYVARYFDGFVPSVAFNPFLKEKEANTLRVFALGGSSTAGFPYHFYYGFPAQLERRLTATFPDRQVEVINLGMTAVNSYTLWDLRHEIAALRPDAVVIYAGHNEFYGAMGVGSAMNALGDLGWLKRLILRVRRTALYTLLENAFSATAPSSNRTLMARMVRDATISYDGPVFQAGVDQFARNMDDVLATFTSAQIPVYVGTLVSNLKDQPPLGEDVTAQAAFAEGQMALAQGDSTAARAAFLQAKEWDDIRFRAPEAMNETLHRLAETHPVTLVNLADSFNAQSSSSFADNHLFTDHLHPNHEGYDHMAQAFFAAMSPQFQTAESPAIFAPLPLDPFEHATTALQLGRLKAGYPFNKTRTPDEERAFYADLLAQYRTAGPIDSLATVVLSGQLAPAEGLADAIRVSQQTADTLTTLSLYQSLLHWQPFNTGLHQEAIGYALNSPTHLDAVVSLAHFSANQQPSAYVLNALGSIYLRQNRLAEAGQMLNMAETHDPNDPTLLFNKARLLIFQGDTVQAQTYFNRYRQHLQNQSP